MDCTWIMSPSCPAVTVLYYITLNCITLDYITLHNITLHYITFFTYLTICSHVILIQCYSVVEHSAASTVTLTLHRNLLAIELDWASLQNMSLTPMHPIFINNTDDTHTLAAILKFISHPQSI